MEDGPATTFISTSTFLKQQWSLVFDANTRARLLKPSCLRYNLQNEQNKHLYQRTCIAGSAEFKDAKVQEVLVTTIDPYPAGEGEGMQKGFAFIKLRTGYKFCGYSTIP